MSERERERADNLWLDFLYIIFREKQPKKPSTFKSKPKKSSTRV